MPVVYTDISCYSTLLIFLALTLIMARLLFRRTHIPRWVIIIAVLVVNIALGVFGWYPLASRLSVAIQGQIAQPYIQKALDTQCVPGKFTADTAGFYIQSHPYGGTTMTVGETPAWKSSDGRAECTYYSYDYSWKCSCP